MLQIVDFSLKVLYQLGRKMVISDALSCLSTHQTPDTKETVPGLNVTIHEISVFSNTDRNSIQQIWSETQTDSGLQTLLQYIMKGFPATSPECHESIKPYFNYRDELTVVGLILKGNRIVVPTKLRHSCLATLHVAHTDGNKTLLQARQSIFWPGITKDIMQLV